MHLNWNPVYHCFHSASVDLYRFFKFTSGSDFCYRHPGPVLILLALHSRKFFYRAKHLSLCFGDHSLHLLSALRCGSTIEEHSDYYVWVLEFLTFVTQNHLLYVDGIYAVAFGEQNTVVVTDRTGTSGQLIQQVFLTGSDPANYNNDGLRHESQVITNAKLFL